MRYNFLSIQIFLKICLIVSIHPIDVAYAQSTIKPQLEVYAVDQKGEKSKNFTILRKILIKSNYIPLLPMVFFDKNSSIIPERYEQDSSSTTSTEDKFALEYFNKSTLSAYYSLLHIIGERLARDSNYNEKIKLVAYNDKTESKDIALERAKSVKLFLKNTYKINEDRIIIDEKSDATSRAKNINRTVKQSDVEFIDAENRRVEIMGNWNITKPLFVKSYDTSYTPPSLFFKMDLGVESEKLSNQMLYGFQVNTSLGNIDTIYTNPFGNGPLKEVVWEIGKNSRPKPIAVPMDFRLDIQLEDGQVYNSEVIQRKVENKNRTKTKDLTKNKNGVFEYNLILFEHGSAELSDTHKRILDIINEEALNVSGKTISIYGFCDTTGNIASNKKLSQQRADSVKMYLLNTLQITASQNTINSQGVGNMDLFNDNYALPESRMYCRTVKILLLKEEDDDE